MSHPYDDDCSCDVCMSKWMEICRSFEAAAMAQYGDGVELVPEGWKERALRAERDEQKALDEIEELRVRLTRMVRSRDMWKAKAKRYMRSNRALHEQVQELKR